MSTRFLRTASFLALASSAIAASAQTAAFAPTGGSVSTLGSYSVGYSFTVSAPIAVSSLGFYDYLQDGLGSDREVGIFTTNGALLRSAIVPSGTAGTLVGSFRYTSLATPLVLLPGTYVAGATVDGNDYTLFNTATNPAAGITYGQSMFDSRTGAALNFPRFDDQSRPNGLFGPNFLFASQPTPEPSTWAAIGLGAVAVLRRRKRS